MSICAPAWVPAPKLSWAAPLLICGANPKWMPRFIPASLPFASKVANAGSSPVRRLLFEILLRGVRFVFSFVNTQNAFTFPAKENDHPLDICIVSWALAAAGQSSATATDNSARRFIRKFLLGSLPAQDRPLVPCEAPAMSRGARYSRVGTWLSHQ